MFVFLFCFNLVSMGESKYKEKSLFIKGCLHLDKFVQNTLSRALYPINAVLRIRKCPFRGLAIS